MTLPHGLRPVWLRPTTIALITLLHVAAITVVRGIAAPVLPSSAPILEIAAAPEPAAELQPAPAASAEVEPDPPEPQVEPDPPVLPEAVIPPPPEPVADMIVRKAESKPEVRKRETKKPERTKRIEPRAAEQQQASSEARAASEAATATARAAAASYSSSVAAEFARHKHYPDSAKSQRIQGTAVLSFVIGPSGSLVSSSITRSSGNDQLDAAVRAMAAASHFPPPPGGRFASAIPVHFSMAR